MAPRKTERIVNLTIALLAPGRYLPKSRTRELGEGYPGLSAAGFERTFERDKDELRALGVPIEVGGYDPLFEDEAGYRIVRSAFELPEITLEADEAAVIGLAARVWQQAGLASATTDALRKLRAAGVEVDRAALDVVQPQLAADEPAFEAFFEGVSQRRPVTFSYRRASATAPA